MAIFRSGCASEGGWAAAGRIQAALHRPHRQPVAYRMRLAVCLNSSAGALLKGVSSVPDMARALNPSGAVGPAACGFLGTLVGKRLIQTLGLLRAGAAALTIQAGAGWDVCRADPSSRGGAVPGTRAEQPTIAEPGGAFLRLGIRPPTCLACRPPCWPAPPRSIPPSSLGPRSWAQAAGCWPSGRPPGLDGPWWEAWRCLWWRSQVRGRRHG